jgi:hypothetical protein
MSQSNPPERFCWVVRDGWCPNPTSQSCMVCGPSCSGYYTPWVVGSLDRSCLVFGPCFPYKLYQLSSSNKNLGRCKFSPSIQKNIALMVPDLASKFARMHTSWKGFILHGKENTSSLLESGIALAARNFLECQNQTAKERIVSLAVVTWTQGNIYFLAVVVNRQGIIEFPWQFITTAKEITYFLECTSKPPKNDQFS